VVILFAGITDDAAVASGSVSVAKGDVMGIPCPVGIAGWDAAQAAKAATPSLRAFLIYKSGFAAEASVARWLYFEEAE